MKKESINIQFRIAQSLHQEILNDLKRPHDYAFERVGFIYTKTVQMDSCNYIVLATKYVPVSDKNYIKDDYVGAKINSTAIREAMQGMIDFSCGCFHVHFHGHKGKPFPSITDSEDLPELINSFNNITTKEANGFLILSEDGFYAETKIGDISAPHNINSFSGVGYPMILQYPKKRTKKTSIYDRQSFLGKDSQFLFENIKVGIVGYGGGGSHIGQQLAHIGVKNITVFDDDKTEESNLNRLIGAVYKDILNATPKTDIAKRVIKKIFPDSKTQPVNSKWQKQPKRLQRCDIVFGCIDSYSERHQLEAECRRFLIPLIDIGMDVYKVNSYSMSGQIILSMPGHPCMSCFGFLTEDKLEIEAKKYGDIGGRPQVVWSNGSLASTAVGIFVDLVTGWSGEGNKSIYLAYDGNTGKIEDHIRVKFCPENCTHYPINEVGPATYKKL